MRAIVIASLLLGLTASPAWATPKSEKNTKPADRAAPHCPCGGPKLCVGPKGGKFCVQPNGKKRYQK